MAKVRITQVKSRINRPKKQKLTLDALGLTRNQKSVEVEETAQVAGMINKVSHLVKVEKL